MSGRAAVSVEKRAVVFATKYLESQGYGVTDVSRDAAHRGYDLVAIRQAESLKIEVKGCTRPWGIPDPYVTEFDEERRLVADFLYVVYFLEDAEPQLCCIPREAIDPSFIVPRSGYRISSRFRKASNLSKYFVK